MVFESTEFLRVDYTFFKKGDAHKWKVPQIFIESENSWESSYEEAIKLCSLNAPLKILIQYDLTPELKAEIEGHETNWDYIFEDFVKESELIGLFVLMICDRQENMSLTVSSVVYGQDGKAISKDVFKVEPSN
ncbi:hypothetical protein LZZ85_00865 [Terrimonas sp. NA20]|uniref:Uncharacterized protein n=1 Tax=Terrimonas ginsenosidimutans TaxID=2908004 RepID=A0ABS9KKG0_9BACT|nr:hypothetical protein [Terrimonas ginsenosidimutans]MCG2612802.1 hypothetical protein [Terrimonas ginsenosidimutans]